MPTNWTLIHANGTREPFLPSDSKYSKYVSGNGVCEDIRYEVDPDGLDPYAGSYFVNNRNISSFNIWMNSEDNIRVSIQGVHVEYPWSPYDLFDPGELIAGKQCSPGTDCTDCATSPPPSMPP